MFASSAVGSNLDKALAVAQPENIYYYGSKTLKKQSIPTVQRTSFVQSLASTSGGQSVITISPQAGISHIIIGFKLPEIGGALTYEGLSLAPAWAYHAIDYIQFRYGSSSLYQKNSGQLLIESLVTAGSQSEANALIPLGGNALIIPDDFQGDKMYGYAVCALPHCGSNAGSDVPNPFPSELLNAPIVITVSLKRPQDLFGAIGDVVYPTAFEEAYLQVRSIDPIDRGQLMTISPSVSYAFPTTFFQQANNVDLKSTTISQEVVLTGFRSGSCKGVYLYLVDTADTANPFNFVLPRDIVLTYAGNVIHNYKGVSSQILDTLFTDVPSYFNNTVLSVEDGAWVANPALSNFVHLPLSQRFEQLSAENTTVTGLGIANGVMNLRLTTPSAKSTWRLYYVPYYDVALMFNNGNMEYVF